MMKTKRMLVMIGSALIAATAMAQSNGRSFDAVIVLNPGMALERGAAVINGGWQTARLQHGDVIYSEGTSGRIVTTDGSVIGLGNGSVIAIDGRQIGFDVFLVMSGQADILGNINNGYPMPPEFVGRMPWQSGNVTIYPHQPWGGNSGWNPWNGNWKGNGGNWAIPIRQITVGMPNVWQGMW